MLFGEHSTVGPESYATSLGGSPCSAGAFADHLAFVLGECRHDMEDEPGGVRHVHGQEVGLGFHEHQYEGHASCQAIQFGDQQRCLLALTEGKGFLQLRPVVFAAVFDLDKPSDQIGGPADEELPDGFLLGLKAVAGGNPVAIRSGLLSGPGLSI
jgi:hypothetical protein